MMGPSWEERWQRKVDEPFPAADPWLQKQLIKLPGGHAIDLAAGRGRNSLLLAEAGYQVLALDSSPTALALLRTAAQAEKKTIEVLQHDLETGLPTQPPATDLILCFYYLQRNLFPAIKTLVTPGGFFIARSFCQLSPQTKISPIIYEPGELAEIFSDWEILDSEERVEPARRGGTLTGIIARKPSD